MAKKLEKVTPPAERFWSNDEPETTKEVKASNPPKKVSTNHPSADTIKKRGVGRPKKTGLKNECFSITLNPEFYEKLRVVAGEEFDQNISKLIVAACKSYCSEIGYNLRDIDVPKDTLDAYFEKQKKRLKK